MNYTPNKTTSTQSYRVINLEQIAEANDADTPLNLHNIAYENFHGPVFHAWLNLTNEERREVLRDRYVFFSVCRHLGKYLGDLAKLDYARANGFVVEIMEHVSFISQERIPFTEEWFRGLVELAGTLTEENYVPEARSIVAIGLHTGVIKFPGIAQSLAIHAAYLDALIGRHDKASKVALRLVRRPYLLPNRRELPRLYQKLMYILAASNHIFEYKLVLWKGVSSLHADAVLRDNFTAQIVKTYRGAFRALLHRDIPLTYRFPFLLSNLARVIAASRFLALLQVHIPLRWFHFVVLYVLDYVNIRKPITANNLAITKPGTASLPNGWFRLTYRFNPRRILVTRAMGGIGDLLMMTPGLMALARKYPDSHIDFAIPKSFHAIFEGLENVRLLDINEDDIDIPYYHRWINLTDCPAGRTESQQYPNVRRNRIESFARAMGIGKWRLRGTVGYKPFYFITSDEKIWAEKYLREINPSELQVIGIQPFAADSYKNWPYMEELTERLSKDNIVLLFHHENIEGFDFGNVIKVKQTFRESAALAAACSRLVVVDSSFLHLAAALEIPTVALFFATSGRVFTRHYPYARIVTPKKSDFPCYPCWRNENKPCHLTKGRESICARSIAADQVIDALNADISYWRVEPNLWNTLNTWVRYGRE